ncbi:MAG: tRNA (adenosine(37)-N6)-dimethylallyltransferase MiaA [Candidatus Saccharimonadales bacterium]
MATRLPLIAIVGPTASGKTSLALSIAERYNGEIICADSRTIYRGMDIGTAKPSPAEQKRVRHWGLDLVEPGEHYSAAEFQQYAMRAIDDIRKRGKLPLLVGGTGLYVDAVLYDYTFGPKASDSERRKLEQQTVEQLYDYCINNNVTLPENLRNKRHLIRAIERQSVSGIGKSNLQADSFIVGIATPMKVLRTRIVQRSEHIFADDVEKEATMLGKKYGWNSEAMTGNIYPLFKLYLEGTLSHEEVRDKFATLDYRLAKRQMTWLRRNPDIMWVGLTEAESYIQSLLAAE